MYYKTARIPLVIACFSLSVLSAFASSGAIDIFDDSVVHDLKLTIDPKDWASLRQNYLDNTYYNAQFTWRDISLTIAIRSRGRGSRSAEKPNLYFNLDKVVKKQTFLGLSKLVVNASNQDASGLHEFLTYKLFQRMGLPAPRKSFAKLYINGEYFGFYTIVENVDETFLSRGFGENNGYLYEWSPDEVYHFEWLGDDPALYLPTFLDASTHEDDPNPQPFIDMVRVINFSSDADLIPALSKFLNPKLYLTHAAIENVVTELDGILGDTYGMNNFYIYRFENQDLNQLIAWDKDLTFRQPERDILQGVQDNVLARRLMAIPEYKQVYLNALVRAASLMGGVGGWADQEAAREYNVIRDAAVVDPHKQCITQQGSLIPCTAAVEFDAEYQNVKDFIATRSSYVLSAAQDAGYHYSATGPAITFVTATANDSSGNGLAAGSLVSIRGNDLGGDASAQGLPLPRIMGNGFVAVNGVRAPLVLISPVRADIQLPWDIPNGLASIVVSDDGALSNTLDITVARTAPAVIVLTHLDGSIVDSNNPATAGETLVLWTTGLGPVNAQPATGAAAVEGSTTTEMAEVSLEGSSANVTYSGLAAGFVGLYQVNFELPSSMPDAASVSLTLSIGGQTVTILVPLR